MKRSSLLGVASLSLMLAAWAGCSSSGSDQPIFSQAPAKDSGAGDVSQDTKPADGQAGSAGSSAGGGAGEAGSAGTGGEAGSAGASAGAGGEAGGGGTGGEEGDAMPDVDFTYDAPPEVAPEACATANVEAKLKPLDMYFMLDRSGSMSGSPWSQQAAALNSFWNDPASAGITAALRFFPYDDSCAPMDATCTGNLYITPEVAWGVLPGAAAALGQAITNTSTMGCTPTEEALKGALKGSKQRQISLPSHVVVAVIVSDGGPTDCNTSASYLQNLAQSFFNGTPSIRTFALYVASSATATMTAIAQGGGTNQSYDATNTQNFLAALKAIQGSAIPCDFDMPVPDAGTIDPAQVTLDYQGTPITHIDNATQCGANGGWYYDNNTDPKKIMLCPASCNLIKMDPNAKVNVSLGCLGS
ncbi:MAG: VWA domain-containing protein [Deltaproteobacteria bacterium]|nr:VWA domain-containing protein [Deltaproteobacteria bacterium]